jgi:hypothetical protein|tara:strand:+ start:4058 stop:5638 length:1581 start_codon:yes stop_codon:yes gene_type:complete
MGAYRDYKIIADNSSAAFQANVQKQVATGFKTLAVNQAKRDAERKEQAKRNNALASNIAKSQIKTGESKNKEEKENDKANNDGLAAAWNQNQFDNFDKVNELTNLSLVATPQNKIKYAQEIVNINNQINDVRLERDDYIGSISTNEATLKDTASLNTAIAIKGVVNTRTGEADDGLILQEAMLIQTNQSTHPNNKLKRNEDGSYVVSGVYNNAEGNLEEFEWKSTNAEFREKMGNPTYKLLNGVTTAVTSINKSITDGKNNISTKALDKFGEEIFTQRTRTDGLKKEIVSETGKTVNQAFFNDPIAASVFEETNKFKASTINQKRRAIGELGMKWDNVKEKITGSEEDKQEFYTEYSLALQDAAITGVLDFNKDLRRDEYDTWYLHEKTTATKYTPKDSVKDAKVVDRLITNFNPEGTLTIADMGIANNSKIYYKSGSRTVSSSKIIDNGTSLYPMPALQFLINEADGNPGVGEYTQAEYVIIPIMDTQSMINTLKSTSGIKDGNQLEKFVKKIQDKARIEYNIED